ncbi:MAG: single-stranded DNA-binding protein [Cyanobacteria bacterium RUI128]|nr:single-stranded DNA-binding protein [Cyanobacteria bacterium RUI128]
MTLAKATVTGTVYRAPEKRFTQNDVAVFGLTLKVDDNEELLVRVVSKRKSLAGLLDGVKMGDRLLVDGRLQVSSTKSADGSERKYFEIDASDIELLSASGNLSAPAPSQAPAEEVKFGEFEAPNFAEEEEVLIGEDEIPF